MKLKMFEEFKPYTSTMYKKPLYFPATTYSSMASLTNYGWFPGTYKKYYNMGDEDNLVVFEDINKAKQIIKEKAANKKGYIVELEEVPVTYIEDYNNEKALTEPLPNNHFKLKEEVG